MDRLTTAELVARLDAWEADRDTVRYASSPSWARAVEDRIAAIEERLAVRHESLGAVAAPEPEPEPEPAGALTW
ncbi:hypothetical protein [Methylobacterium pseudosasicola]|nr:hypothetical protein [Methylobacterium pseudosasicola]